MTPDHVQQLPDSIHIAPIAMNAGDGRVLLRGNTIPVAFRIIAENEYQLLLAGFKAAGGKVQGEPS